MESCDSSLNEFDLGESEIDNSEYSIPPPGSPPTLDSVLRDLAEKDDNIDFRPVTTDGSLLHHVILQGISSQLTSAGERVDAGVATALVTSCHLITVGTAHGVILTFDSSQTLRWCSREQATSEQGAVSALAMNTDATRLLAGFERGHISMLDTMTGDILRNMPDAHAPFSAVLHLRFADWPSLAFCGDSAGCVFSMSFGRRLGVRTWNSKCLFSGARGEVCAIEVLHSEQTLRPYVLLAMATLSKVILVSTRPRLRIVFTHSLSGNPSSLPLLAWEPRSALLAFGRGRDVFIHRIAISPGGGVRALSLRHGNVPRGIRAFHWLGPRALSCLGADEVLRLVDAHSLVTKERLDIASVGLVYASAHFKALAMGGNVSAALAKAGEHACYNSCAATGRRLLLLGVRGLHAVRVRTTRERLEHLRTAGKWSDALRLAAAGLGGRERAIQLVKEYVSGTGLTKDGLAAAVQCCITLHESDMLSEDLWDKISDNPETRSWYFAIIGEQITNGNIKNLSPIVVQSLVDYHDTNGTVNQLEPLLPCLEVECLDLHQVLGISKRYSLHSLMLWLNASALHDYVTPLIELLPSLSDANRSLGNVLLVYLSCCLAGRAYPRGDLPPSEALAARSSVMCHLMTPPYTLLKALLDHDAYGCVSMFELTFADDEFVNDTARCRRQQIVLLLLELVPKHKEDAVLGLIARGVLSDMFESTAELVTPLTEWLGHPSEGVNKRRKEKLWLELIAANKLSHLSHEELVSMAKTAKCYQVLEYLYEQSRDFNNIVECYLKDDERKNDVFKYMDTHSQSPVRAIRDQLLDHFDSLLEINENLVVEFVARQFPELIEKLCEQLEESPKTLALLIDAALSAGVCGSSKLAALSHKTGDHVLIARTLEASGDLVAALDLLLERGAAVQAAALCARAPQPTQLLDTVTEPRLLGRLLRAALDNCAYEQLLYETVFKLLSNDLHTELCKELNQWQRGRVIRDLSIVPGCINHKSCSTIVATSTVIESDPINEIVPRPDLEGIF